MIQSEKVVRLCERVKMMMKRFVCGVLVCVLCLSLGVGSAETELSDMSAAELLALRAQIDQCLIDLAKVEIPEGNELNGLVFVSNGQEIRINQYIGSEKQVVIPDEIGGVPVTMIHDNVFYNSDCTSVVLPEGIVSIGEDAFRSSDIDVIVYPSTVRELGSYQILNSNVRGVVVQSDITTELWLFNSSRIEFVFITPGAAPKLRGKNVFNETLKLAIIPESVTDIADGAFVDCNKLVIVTPAGSYAEQYAREHFIVCNTADYDSYVAQYSELYLNK